MNLKTLICRLFLAGIAAVPTTLSAAEEPINVTRQFGTKIIPLSLTGYTGEAMSVLRFDLEVAGFEIVTDERAQYALSGKNDASQVEGRLQDKLSKATLLAKAYTGDNTRAQSHALADEVVQAILKIPGIARTKIVFKQQPQAVGNGEIYIADYDGQNAKAVTTDNTIVAAPVWVPKHWHIFYTSYKSSYPWIYTHNLTTGERRPFAKFPGLNSSASISPDGTKVAMILSKGGSPDLWVSNIDGTGLLQLTKTATDESSPCWSPDGSKLCFASRSEERRGLFVIASTGGEMKRLNTGGEPNPSEPDWSPDGKTIVFTSQSKAGFAICVMSSQGGEVQPPLAEGEDPSWAPNSRTVIFTRRVGSKRVLSLLDVPTKRVKDTAQISGSRSQPNWAK
jgi:TolB protein